MIDSVIISNKWQGKRLAYASLILLLNAAGFLYFIYFLNDNGYLPSPFINDKSDTFMDLFNVLYWAYDDGRYTDWATVYPPLSFMILKIVNFVFAGGGYGDPANMRDNSQFAIVGICLTYLAIPAIILKTRLWQDFLKPEKILIYFSIILSSPMLFTLERGNLILLTPVLLALAISKIGMTRCIFIALLINIKPYFALLLIYYIARQNWKGLATASVLSGLIFAILGLAIDDNFFSFFSNLLNFSQEAALFSLREVMALPSSISAFSYVLKHPDGAMFAADYLSSDSLIMIVYSIETIKWCIIAIALAALFMKSKQLRDSEIFTLLVIATCNLGIWVGGYTFILYITLIPIFIKLRVKWIYIGLLSLIAMPLDVIPIIVAFIGEQYSYLATAHINIWWTLGLGSVIRPIANLILLLFLSREFLARKNENTNNNTVHQAGVFVNGSELVERR